MWQLSAYRYDTVVEPEAMESLPYYFRVDTDPTEWGMVVVVEYYDEKNMTFRSLAYRDTIKVVEPEMKFWEPQMLFLYALLAALAYGAFLFVKESLFPDAKGGKKRRTVVEPVTEERIMKARGNEGGKVAVDNEWIPKHVQEVHGPARSQSPPKTSPKVAKKQK